jgi:hypothetical protein
MYQIGKGVKNCQTRVKIGARCQIINLWKDASCWTPLAHRVYEVIR